MTALPEDLEVLLDAERDIDMPAPAARERLFERLEPLLVPAAVALGAAAASATTSATSAATTSAATTTADATGAALGVALKAKIGAAIVSAALVGGVVGAAGHAYVATPAPPAKVTGTVLARSNDTVPSAPALPAAEPPAPATATAPSAPAAPAPSVPRQERTRAAGSLRAERLLLETASAALMRGDPKSAIAALRQHAQKFPAGDLAEEREVLLVKALAAAGDQAAADQRAKEFKKKFPDSIEQRSVDDTDRSR